MTLSHPHGQIYAYPFVTPRVEKILALGAAGTGRRPAATCSPRCVAAERVRARGWSRPTSTGRRSCPAAARWPYEVQFFPPRRVPDLPALTDAERDAFVDVYLDVLARFARRFDTPMPYIAVLEPGAGAQPGARTGGCTCSCSRCAARPAS